MAKKRKAKKKAKKHKAFGIVRREIAKQIRAHKRARRGASKGKRKKLDLAVRNLTTLSKGLAATYTSRTCIV